jgi:hypothetical protein
MLTLSCDPGLTGAIALLCSTKGLLECADLPVCANGQDTGKMRQWLDAGALSDLVQDWSWRHEFAKEALLCVVERPIAMPGGGGIGKDGKKKFGIPAQTVASQFDTFGAVRMLMTIRSREPVATPNPKEWQKVFGLKGGDKEASMACAQRLYPDAPLKFKKHHNRAEAILIGHWLLKLKE